MKHIKPEALEVGDVIHIDPYDLELTHIRPDTTARVRSEYNALLLRLARGEHHTRASQRLSLAEEKELA